MQAIAALLLCLLGLLAARATFPSFSEPLLRSSGRARGVGRDGLRREPADVHRDPEARSCLSADHSS